LTLVFILAFKTIKKMSAMNTKSNSIQAKLDLLNLAQQLGSVSQACQLMGYSRDSYYRFKKQFEAGGEQGLREISRRKPILKNRVEPHVEEAVVQLAFDQPAFGQVRVANELRNKGIIISPGGVRCVWKRHDLETFAKRLEALDAKVKQDGLILTRAQLIAMKRK
jgi:hypothetical protein